MKPAKPYPDQDDATLATKIGDAVKAYDAADAVKKEKAIIAGRLLVEAQKRHPSDKAFEKFLLLAGGIQIRRAKDLIAIALGRKGFHAILNLARKMRGERTGADLIHPDARKAGEALKGTGS